MPKPLTPQTLTGLAKMLARNPRAFVAPDSDSARAAGNKTVIDISGIPGLAEVSSTGRRVSIGAGATFGRVLRDVNGENGLVRQAISTEEKVRQDLENARRSAAQAARQAYLGVNNGMAQVNALEQALVSSQSALDSNKLGYEVGVRINIDVLNAQQQLFSTKRDKNPPKKHGNIPL